MNLEREKHDELDELLGALRDGVITDPQMQRLDAMLLAEPEAMRYYLDYVSLCGGLRQYHGVGWHSKFEAAEQPEAILVGGHKVGYRIGWLALAASVAVVAGLLGFWLNRADVPTVATDERPTFTNGPAVAVLTRVADLRWVSDAAQASAGQALSPGKMKIASGMAQVEFYCGATVVLEGPAEFDIVSDRRGFFHHGKVRANVPPQASGFTIGAPGMDVVDLGTEFGLQLGKDGVAEVHVFDGKVELVSAASLAKQELTTGRGLRIEPSGYAQEIAINSHSFATPARLAGLSGDAFEERRIQWLQHSLKMQDDEDVLFYASFEGQNPWDRTLRNWARNRTVSVGAIVGSQWSQGRWPGKGSLEFKRTSDRVRITVPGEYKAMTFAAWVRFDGFDRRWNSLMLTDSWSKSDPHWQVSWDGEIILGVNSGQSNGINYTSPKGVLGQADLGRWVQLVTVYDPAGKVTHYLDGRPVTTTPVPIAKGDPTAPLIPLKIGSAEIGNWANSTDLRNLNGRMDEFILFRRALSPAEIQNLYEAGRPIL